MDDRLKSGGFAPRAMSRRTALARLGWGSATVVALLPSVACAQTERPEGDDDALLARILAGPEPVIPRREQPYRLTRTLPIEGGKTVLLQRGTHIVWAGALSQDGLPIGVFEAGGDDVTLATAEGGEAVVECETPSSRVYAALMRGRRGFTVRNIRSLDCQHVYIGAAVEPYEAIRTEGAGSNVARDVRISGGGARFRSLPEEGRGACFLAYVIGAHVTDVDYETVGTGVQWWGGDSGLDSWQNGARANERKCRDVLIERASVKHSLVGGIWGSMGHDITVRDCQVAECLDIGFDAEGCDKVTFERCVARNGHNGCFTIFALNDDIRFVDCRGTVDKKNYPLFRVYNVTQSNAENRRVTVEGGHFECLDQTGPSTLDCASGPVRELSITNATLRNVRIDTVFLNMHRTVIADNELTFPLPLSSAAAIRAGSSQGTPDVPGGATVANNRIHYAVAAREAASADAPVAIEMVENDYNSNATSTVVGNVISGPFALGIVLVNASANAGIVPLFEISGNRFEGLARSAELLRVDLQGEQARAPAVRWDERQTRDGKAVGQVRALVR